MINMELASAYDRLSSHDQTRFLVNLCHELTIAVRGCYSDKPQVVNSRAGSPVGNLNEIQHRIAGYLDLLLEDKPDRPSGADLFGVLFLWADNGRFENALADCIERAMSYLQDPKIQ